MLDRRIGRRVIQSEDTPDSGRDGHDSPYLTSIEIRFSTGPGTVVTRILVRCKITL